MDYTFDQRCLKIKEACLHTSFKDPIKLFINIASQDYIRIHGPEHHILDGACLLTAYYNAGGQLNLEEGLDYILEQGKKMPGAICGLWGVCGSTTSVGSALAFIDHTGPLTKDNSWGDHFEFSSKALSNLAKTGGPRCCKRDAYISILTGVDYINSHYPIHLDKTFPTCGFYSRNEQCLKERCPFNPKGAKLDFSFN